MFAKMSLKNTLALLLLAILVKTAAIDAAHVSLDRGASVKESRSLSIIEERRSGSSGLRETLQSLPTKILEGIFSLLKKFLGGSISLGIDAAETPFKVGKNVITNSAKFIIRLPDDVLKDLDSVTQKMVDVAASAIDAIEGVIGYVIRQFVSVNVDGAMLGAKVGDFFLDGGEDIAGVIIKIIVKVITDMSKVFDGTTKVLHVGTILKLPLIKNVVSFLEDLYKTGVNTTGINFDYLGNYINSIIAQHKDFFLPIFDKILTIVITLFNGFREVLGKQWQGAISFSIGRITVKIGPADSGKWEIKGLGGGTIGNLGTSDSVSPDDVPGGSPPMGTSGLSPGSSSPGSREGGPDSESTPDGDPSMETEESGCGCADYETSDESDDPGSQPNEMGNNGDPSPNANPGKPSRGPGLQPGGSPSMGMEGSSLSSNNEKPGPMPGGISSASRSGGEFLIQVGGNGNSSQSSSSEESGSTSSSSTNSGSESSSPEASAGGSLMGRGGNGSSSQNEESGSMPVVSSSQPGMSVESNNEHGGRSLMQLMSSSRTSKI